MTAPPSPPLRVGAGADRGKVRDENQDRISRFRSSFGEVFVVADGVGGYQGGAQAAEMVIEGLETHLRELAADTPPAQALQEAARRTSADVHRRAQSGDPATAQMGATGVLALLAGRQVRVGHAGDCRAYLLRGDELIRLTRDHTRIQAMLDKNLLSAEEARDHPDASIVTRAFGKEADLALEVSEPFELQDRDLLLLSSDGLCGYVDDAAIRTALLAGGDAQDIANRLIGLALDAGGEDNVSVQVILLPGGAVQAAAPLLPAAVTTHSSHLVPPPARRPFSRWIVAILLLLAFLAGWLVPWSHWIEAGKKLWRGNGKTEPAVQEPERRGPRTPERRNVRPPAPPGAQKNDKQKKEAAPVLGVEIRVESSNATGKTETP